MRILLGVCVIAVLIIVRFVPLPQSDFDSCCTVNIELEDFPDIDYFAKNKLKNSQSVTLSGSVERANGSVQYSRMVIFDPSTHIEVYNGNVCFGGSALNLTVPSGIYNIYYRGYVGGAQSYEVYNVDLTQDLDTTFVLTPYSDPSQLLKASFLKNYIYTENSDFTSIVAELDHSTNIDSIFWYTEYAGVTNSNGDKLAKVILLDDGLNNDEVAGDHIFTSPPFSIGSASLIREGKLSSAYSLFFRSFTQGSSQGTRPLIATNLGLVGQNAIESSPLVQVNDSVYVNDYIINLVTDINKPNEDISKIVYDLYNDTFDFVNIFIPELGSSTNYHQSVSNAITGIGLPTFDNSQNYGSQGFLKGISVFPILSYQPPINHEVLHQWSSFMNDLFNTQQFGSHNGLSSIYGVHGGLGPEFNVVNSNTVSYQYAITYGFSSDQREFADLELYLMGALDTSDLRDTFFVIENPVYQSSGLYSVDNIDVVTPQTITNTYGYRSPSPSQAPLKFRTATIVVTSTLLSQAGVDFNTYLTKLWEGSIPGDIQYKSFSSATMGRADMITLLPDRSSCIETLMVGQTGSDISSGSYEAQTLVTSSSTVPQSNSVLLQSGGSICLEENFTTQKGGILEAVIAPCN